MNEISLKSFFLEEEREDLKSRHIDPKNKMQS